MDLSPTDAELNAITGIDLYKTDEKYDFKLSDILRKRQRPLLLLLDQKGDLLYTSEPVDGRSGSDRRRDPPAMEPRLIEEAVVKAQQLFHEQAPASSVVKQLVINKPGERCALVILENQFYCMRLFRLNKSVDGAGEIYAALLESISKPKSNNVDLRRLKGLYRLTKREGDVVDALMSGNTDKQIATQLGVGVETVRAYLKSVRAKLGVQTRTAIVSAVHSLQGEGLAKAKLENSN